MKYSIRSGKGDLVFTWKKKVDSKYTIIYLHDSLGSIALWRDFPELIDSSFSSDIFIYDRLGYGLSDRDPELRQRGDDYLHIEAEILVELIKDLSIKNPILFGHSDGGSIALIAASIPGNTILGVVTEGAHVFVEEITLEGIMNVHSDLDDTKLEERLEKYHPGKVQDVLFAWIETWQRPSFRNWTLVPLLPQITVPVLVIQGEDDEFGSPLQVDAIVQSCAGISEGLMIENAKHTPHKENRAMTFDIVSQFLNKHFN